MPQRKHFYRCSSLRRWRCFVDPHWTHYVADAENMLWFTTTFDLIFNADKSKFIHFPCGSSCSSEFEKLQICFDGKTSINTSRESHLGNISLVLSKVILKENFSIHFVWQCTALNIGTTPPMLLRHFIPHGGALMDYIIKLIKLYYLYCGGLNPYIFNFINVL